MNLFDVYPLYNVVPKKAKDVYGMMRKIQVFRSIWWACGNFN